jgi:hypothetical protein
MKLTPRFGFSSCCCYSRGNYLLFVRSFLPPGAAATAVLFYLHE